MRPEDAGEGVMVPSQVVEDALGTVPVDEYETVFSFPTVGKNSEMCLTRCRGFWLTFYVDAARSDSGQGPRGNKTKYARSLRAFKARGSKHDPPKVFVSTRLRDCSLIEISFRNVMFSGLTTREELATRSDPGGEVARFSTRRAVRRRHGILCGREMEEMEGSR